MKMTDKTSNILYYSGLIVLVIGAFGLTFAAFFAIIGLPVFAIGVVLVLASLKKTWKQRLIPIGIFIVGIIVFWPGYFGVMVPPVSVKQCHFERCYKYIKN